MCFRRKRIIHKGAAMFGLDEGSLFAILIGIVVFFIVRELMCWYWKINEINGHLRDIKKLLQGQPIDAVIVKPTEANDAVDRLWE